MSLRARLDALKALIADWGHRKCPTCGGPSRSAAACIVAHGTEPATCPDCDLLVTADGRTCAMLWPGGVISEKVLVLDAADVATLNAREGADAA